jgi:polysaccharide pyruvyl transferase WcaK-like protein
MQTLITILNPAIGSENLGDLIIQESSRRYLEQALPEAFFTELPTKQFPDRKSRRLMKRADLIFAVGTNLISSNMYRRNAWHIRLWQAWRLGKVVLFGVGWANYQPLPNAYTRLLLQRMLDADRLHSVRDSYTEQQMRAVGFDNVVNTGCPSLWPLTPEHCARIPTTPAEEVVATITDYDTDPEADRQLLRLLLNSYRRVQLWLQGSGDRAYVQQLLPASERHRLQFILPRLAAFDEALSNEAVDYVGTRLHGGIRALQHGRRTLIIAIDNRATEMGKDFNLPVARRGDNEAVQRFICGSAPSAIRLNQPEIDRWATQFQES